MVDIVVVNEVVVGAITAVLGSMAIAYTSRAWRRLTKGTLRTYVSYFLVCLLFLVGFSILRMAREVFGLRGTYIFVEYGFIGIAYVVFAITSQKMYTMSREFGFMDKSEKIREAMKQNLKKHRPNLAKQTIGKQPTLKKIK